MPGIQSLNIAFCPSPEIAAEAIEVSKSLASVHETFFTLNSNNFFPHLTIYAVDFPGEHLEEIKELVATICADAEPLEMIFTDVEPVLGWIGVNIKRTSQIDGLHKRMVQALNPLRNGYLSDSRREALNSDLPEPQKELIRQFGHPLILDEYIPHLTLTRLKDHELAKQAAKELRWSPKSFVCHRVAVFRSGEHGTCREELASFELS